MSEPLGQTKSAIPLAGENKKPTKIMLTIVFILLALGLNYLIFHHGHEAQQIIKEQENYNLSVNNPVSAAKQKNHLSANPIAENSDLELRHKIAEAKAEDFVHRLQAGQTITNESQENNFAATNASSNNHLVNVGSENQTNDANSAFLLQASKREVERTYPHRLGSLPNIIGQGKFIFGTLAVAINSDLAGQITAIVSEDVYGEQGRRILIPKGSRLIGEYRSGLANNQSRLFTVWTRLIEPNGLDVSLGSEGTDDLGRAGLTGQVDYHFVERFGGSLLLSMISAGAANVGVNGSDQYNSAAAYRQNISQAFAQQSKDMLGQMVNIPPTIHIAQGEKIVVFVNRDLDFSRIAHE